MFDFAAADAGVEASRVDVRLEDEQMDGLAGVAPCGFEGRRFQEPASDAAARQAGQMPWFIRNLGIKVLLSLRLGRVLRRLGRTAPEWPY